MRHSFGQTSSSTVIRLALASAATIMLAGCSGDVTRFASNPFSMDPAPTASIPQSGPAQQPGFEPASVGSVSSQPLAPVASTPLAPPANNYGNARALPPAPALAQPAPAHPAPVAATPKVIAAPPQAQAQIRVQTPAPAAPAKANEKLNFVQGAQPAGAAPAKHAEAPKAAAPVTAAKPADKPAEKVAAKPAEAPVKQAVETPVKPAEKPAAEKPKQVAKLETGVQPAQPAVPAAAPQAAAPQAAAPHAAAEPESDKPEFRWPARGRIIQGFKAGANEGINIAVPEGTAVKAAEAGVVAYAGNELKGYGNLVLIRHPNGFVSAYANNGEITVKRGETVKRGQAIAKSGQSGNVSSPQLHFELRKGSTPVDPTEFLAGL